VGDNSNLAVGFRNVDQTEAPTNAVRFLDAVNTTREVQEMQRLSNELLEVGEGSHILDAGCGLGEPTRSLAALVGKSGRVVGVDLSESILAEARRRTEGTGLSVEYRVSDIHRLDFPDDSFDACRSSRVFIYLDDPRQALGELLRISRPGGRVVIFEPELDSWVLDGPDRNVVRKVIHFWSDQLRNPWIGRQLPTLFHSLGAQRVTYHPVVGTWPLANLEAFGVRSVLEQAVQQGVVTQTQVDDWLHFLDTAGRNGTFAGAMTGMIVRGFKAA
jgi:ubiquinone/menaquinone biosynthesis C-methylase UbiE